MPARYLVLRLGQSEVGVSEASSVKRREAKQSVELDISINSALLESFNMQ